MNDSAILQRYARSRMDDSDPMTLRGEPDATDDCGAFGWLRGVRDRALMLELRKRNGNVLALGYSWLERVEFDPSDGIMLSFVGQRILIKGQNLNTEIRTNVRLFQGIINHRVPWIGESTHKESALFAHQSMVISRIKW